MKYLIIFIIISLINTTIKPQNMQKKAIILGATSGMGREVAKILNNKNYKVAAAGRRTELLESLKKETDNKIIIKEIDVTKHEECRKKMLELTKELGGLDLLVITIGGWTSSIKQEWKYNVNLIEVDILGFFIATDIIIEYFKNQGYGHIAGISSIDAIRGNALFPVYSGVKAFISKYLEGTRNYMIQNKIPITVTEIIPGWVDNETFQFSQMDETYWVSNTKKAAKQIVDAIEKKKKKAYITKRWKIIAKLLEWLPDCIYNAPWWKIRSIKT
ncbi:SDR family NAD(P)-dependent oxidoreductase [Candidatus Dependentiae bacterium]|nr:SDR family NAD(P)-dependent oxidoreductase [Candidatus Dependentiae bacterium]